MDYAGIKKGVHLVLKGQFPCKIINVATSKTGKHGHAKKAVVGIDVITDKKYEEVFNGHSHVDVPTISTSTYNVMYIEDDGYMSLLDENSVPIEDIKLPDGELGNKIKNALDNDQQVSVVVLYATIEDVTHHRVTDVRVEK